ncbi:YihY/virulence factor BrkB family protein [Blastococcus sp. BMG 814]|uniref:YihY/virulence factor BrkB family protein n=1 Tax=Blastococcus carthaginiensis TaxID=3050034 RepID=A0ABT9I9Z2_9ACTN|nr:YihY/virulence factor BrkB family protein [Blastococcus carthaginiensis]MDP5182398.1 YihY/virulence factor BrkB family protein [Blastococcus carthaginiensis]
MAVVRGERPSRGARSRDGARRGHEAHSPHLIPAAGWRRVLRRVVRQVLSDRLMVQSAGVAFFAVLSVAPVLVTALSIYGFVNTPETARRQLSGLADVLPTDLDAIVTDQLTTITAASAQVLTFRGLTGLVVALWTATTAMTYLIDGLGIAYHQPESRSFPHRVGLALVFVLGGAVLLAALLTVAGVAAAEVAGSSGPLRLAARVLSWLALAALMAVALAVLYRFGPDRARARWRWLTPGSVLATVVWLAVTLGFFSYVQSLGSYQSTYGSLAGVAISMFWLWTTVLLIFFGAAVNAEAERQTVRDSTVGPEQPAGTRGAVVADDTPPYPGE